MVINMTGLFRRVVFVCLLAGAIPNSFALTDEQIEERFRQLETENAALKSQLQQVEKVLKSQGVDPEQPLHEQAVVAQGIPHTDTPLADLKQTIDAEQNAVKIEGFMTAGFSSTDEKGGLKHSPYGFNGNADFESDSLVGLQMTFPINDQTKAVTQIVSRGWDDWDLDVEWAYLAYEATDSLTFRAGRMRMPFYLYSESLDVGYSYPWVRPPLALYTTELTNYDGFDAAYMFRTGDVTHRVSAFYGTFQFDENTFQQDVRVSGEDVWGANITSIYNDWTFRLAYTHLKNTADFQVATGFVGGFACPPPPLPPGTPAVCYDPSVPPYTVFGEELNVEQKVQERINYYSYGFSYDDGNWLMIAEAAVTDVSDQNLLSDEVQGAFTLGYHINRWLPYAGYGREYYKKPLEEPSFARTLNRDYKMGILGLRYDISPGVDFKLEWNHYYDFKGTSGPFENADAFVDGESFDKVNVYTFLIDAVF